MDEDQYRSLYDEINPQRCVFEKAITNRRCDCPHKRAFLLATREGIGCQSEVALAHCTLFLDTLRAGSRFALRETLIDGPLPHNKELKVQAGGCFALQHALGTKQENEQDTAATSANIAGLLDSGLRHYHTIADFPYDLLIRGVLNYESRRKRRGDCRGD